MKTSRFYALAFILLFAGVSLFAQDYRSGFIISKSNDTIRGYIYDGGSELYNVCSFKKTANETPADYYPKDILGFRFDEGKFFISKKVPLNKDTSLCFLEYLIQGKANVYFMRKSRDYYFIEKEGGRFAELTQDDKILYDKNENPYFQDNLYKGKLKAIFMDCKDIYPEIERTQLSHKSLIKLAKDYHNRVCNTGECVIFENRVKKVRTNFSILAGVSENKIGFGSQLKSDLSLGSLIGCRLELENVLRWSERISVMFDLNIQRFTNYNLTESDFDRIIYDGTTHDIYKPHSFYKDPSSIDVNIKTVVLKIPISFKYAFSESKFRPYLGGGISNMFVLSQNKDFVLERFYSEYQKSIPTFHLGFVARAGAKYRLNNGQSVFGEFTYEYTQNMNTNHLLRFRNNVISFMSGFEF